MKANIIESLKNTNYIKTLTNSNVSNRDIDESFSEFTQEIYDFCLSEKDKSLSFFTLHYMQGLLLYIKSRTDENQHPSINIGIHFINAALEWIKESDNKTQFTAEEFSIRNKIIWTGKIINFVEWVYGPDSLNNFNNGKVTMKELIEYIGNMLGVKVKDPSGCYVDMRDRIEESRTSYIDSMREALLARMEEDDKKKYRRK